MLHALTAPLLRSVVMGGLLLSVTAVLARSSHHPVTHRLVLDAPERCDAIYLTAFDHDALSASFADDTLTPLVFETRAVMSDGCRWIGTETLVPLDDHRFAYDYAETMLDCPAGATPRWVPTPRTGTVYVAD